MNDPQVLIIDDDAEAASLLTSAFSEAGVAAEVVDDTFGAIEKLRESRYEAVVLDPMIRQRLNGYVILNFMELEQPETLMRLFLLTGMSEETIRRTAPSALPRLFRKPSAVTNAAAAVIEACGRESVPVAEPSASRSVLLVEDDDATAVATVGVLEQLGYSVERLRNGAEVWDVIARRDFDIVMLDLVMPKVDGFAVLDQFHSTKPGLLRRVIVTTGMPEKYVEMLDRSEIGGFIRKPLNVSQLERVLRDVSSWWQPPEAGGEMPF